MVNMLNKALEMNGMKFSLGYMKVLVSERDGRSLNEMYAIGLFLGSLTVSVDEF